MGNAPSKHKMEKLLRLLPIVSLLLSVMSATIIFHAYAQEQTVYVEPPESIFYSNTTAVNSTFTVDVKIRNAANVAGVQFTLQWNSTILKGISIDLPTGHFMSTAPGDESNLWILKKTISSSAAEYAVTYYNITRAIELGYVPKSGNGTLAKITLRIVKQAPVSCILQLTDIVVGDPEANILPTNAEDGSFSYRLPPALMKVEPEGYTAKKVGEVFNISINIYNVDAAMKFVGVEFKLGYNSTLLEVVGVSNGTFMEQAGEVFYFGPFIEDDYVLLGILLLPQGSGVGNWTAFPEGSGTLAIITFNATHAPPASCALELYDTTLADKDANLIEHTAKSGSYSIEYYLFPTIKVEPNTYTATHRNETFSVNITMNDLVVDWHMVGVEFKLRYDPDLLEFVGMSNGTFLEQFGEVFYLGPFAEDDYVLLGILLIPQGSGVGNWTTFPEGNGTLATMTFKVIEGPPNECTLELSDVILADPNTSIIPFNAENGYYKIMYESLVHQIVWGGQTFYVTTESNSTINPVPMLFSQKHRLLMFNITGSNVGYVRIKIPKSLLNAQSADWFLIVGGQIVTPTVTENATYTTLYFTTTSFSDKSVFILGTQVIPEFSPNAILLIFLAITLVGFAATKKLSRKSERLVVAKCH